MQIYLQITDLGVLVERRMAEILEPFGISPGEYRLLLVLLDHGPMTATDMTPYVILEQSLVSRTMQRLYEKQLVSRRAVTLSTTNAGVELAGELVKPLQELDEELTRSIPHGRMQQANQAIATMTTNLHRHGWCSDRWRSRVT